MKSIAIPCMLMGVILAFIGFRMAVKKPHFEREKTTDGKFINILSYEEARKHRHKKLKGKLVILSGVLLLLLGLLLILSEI